MAQNTLAAIAFRSSISALCAILIFASGAPAQSIQAAKAASISGVYNGTYAGAQGPIKFKLSLIQQVNGTIDGTLTFYLPNGTATKEYTCSVSGGFTAANRTVQLLPVKWEALPTDRVVMAGMTGVFDPEGGNHAGQISGSMRARPGPKFEAIRDADESAKMVAAANSPAAINGVYTGEFKPTQTRKLTLSIKATEDGSLTAVFTFGPPVGRQGPSITYKLTGKYDAKAKVYGIGSSPYEFTSIEPIGSGAKEALDASQAQALHVAINGTGSIVGLLGGKRPQGGDFTVGFVTATKDRTQPADLDQAMLAQAGAATAPPAPVVRLPYEGVYNGTYSGGDAPPNKFKLTLWMRHEQRTAAGQLINTEVAGLLTVYATDPSGTMPYTTEVTGHYGGANQTISLVRGRWDPPPSGVVLTNGLRGKLDLGSGSNAVPKISGSFDQPSPPSIQATRDPAESASVDFDRLRKHIYPGTVGVFNGTYTRENGPPTKFKLTVKHDGQTAEIVGLATIYLPSSSGTKAYTYDLRGLAIDHGNFQLRVHDWVTPPPADFKNFKAMGFNGKVVLNDSLTSARISSVTPPSSMAEFYMPQFEATYDATESADINGTLAAQKTIGNAEVAAAMKARDEMMKNAPPKQLASRDLVRKSRQYWDGYRTDMIREIFDGGFGGAMNENDNFQKVFCTFVDTFWAKCPEFLPADHKKVTITEKTNRKVNQYGQIISEDVRTYTVEMDSRFVDTYVKFHDAQFNGAPMQAAIAVAQPGGAQHLVYDLMSMATDMQKFFADHGPKSAAMRQLNENFLRAIKGDLSLQQAGEKIEGAEAESDKDAAPGRFARFVDGANTFFVLRGRANPVKFGHGESHDTALCQRLAELYEFHMTREEEYYYANDFEARFLPIMGIRANCPDPAWPQLHPDVERAIGEVK